MLKDARALHACSNAINLQYSVIARPHKSPIVNPQRRSLQGIEHQRIPAHD
jgi:hypothetical protein